jgi:hypothetical protein
MIGLDDRTDPTGDITMHKIPCKIFFCKAKWFAAGNFYVLKSLVIENWRKYGTFSICNKNIRLKRIGIAGWPVVYVNI